MAEEYEEKPCNEVETVRGFTYQDHRVNASERSRSAQTVRTRCGCVNCRECSKLLHEKMTPLKLKRIVYMT